MTHLAIFRFWVSDDYSLRCLKFRSDMHQATATDPYYSFSIVGSYQSSRSA